MINSTYHPKALQADRKAGPSLLRELFAATPLAILLGAFKTGAKR